MKQEKVLNIIIFGILVLLILLGGYFWLSSRQKQAGGEGGLIDYLPFGKSERSNLPINKPTNKPIDVQDPVVEKPIPRLRQLTTYPVAGIQAITQIIPKTETDLEKKIPTALYVAKNNGLLFKQSLIADGEIKLSALTIPNIEESLFNNSGSSVLFRYLRPNEEIIQTYLGKILSLVDKFPSNNAMGFFLPQEVLSLSFLSDGSKIVYGVQTETGSVWTTSTLDGSIKKQILSSPFKEWVVEWPVEQKVFFTTRASGGISGFSYLLNTASGDFEKIIGNIPGLTTKVNQKGTLLAFNKSGEIGMDFNILTLSTQTILQTGLHTLPEKCVWGSSTTIIYCAVPNSLPNVQYPDSWYQGLVNFSDSIWMIDAEKGNTKLVVNIVSSENKEIDAINLSLDPEEKYLLFVNKNDGTAWSYRLED